MKKYILIIIVILLAVLAIWAPWSSLLDRFLRTTGLSIKKPASLSVTSKVGEATVYVNGKSVGTTPYNEDGLSAGQYDIKLEKVTDTPEFYTVFERSIDIEEGTQVIINWELGPSDEFSSGEIYFFKERLDSTKIDSSVSIIPHPDSTIVYFDGEIQEESPIIVKDVKEGRHKIKVEQEGYMSAEYDVQTKPGYDLFIEFRLFPIPITIDES